MELKTIGLTKKFGSKQMVYMACWGRTVQGKRR